jgi:hypothetical protein
VSGGVQTAGPQATRRGVADVIISHGGWRKIAGRQNNMEHGSSAGVELPVKPQNLPFWRLYENFVRGELMYRASLSVAILSVAFQQHFYWGYQGDVELLFDRNYLALFGLVVLSAFLCLFATTSRIAIILFIAVAAFDLVPRWTYLANHTFLALWTIPFAVLFKEWWKSDLYSLYLRVTIGIVMIAAFAQKLLAGTYIDGSYIYWLGSHGSLTERLFSFTCDNTSGVPCVNVRIVSIFILLWQLTVGILLLLGVRSLVFLAIEIGFLMGAGLFADEMNFQVLVIALLCIIFRVSMPIWLLATCITLLFIDLYEISYLLKSLVQYAA